MYDTFYLPSRWIRFDEIQILNSRSSYISYLYTCTYVRTFNKAYYCENNAAERRRNASSFVERKNTVGRYIRIKRSMNRYSIEPIDIIHDIVLHKDSRSGKTYYNKISFLRMVLLHLECLEIAEEIDFYERGFFETRISASLFFLRINRKE